MLKAKYKDLKDYILEYNPYFKQGFDDVYISESGIVANKKVVFPADNLGNYFYLRLPDNVSIVNSSEYKVSDCKVAMGLNIDTYLIASVKKADADKLLDNLVATLANFGARVKSAIWSSEKVVMQELAKVDQEVQLKALANINTTLVSVRFDYNCTYITDALDCLPNPCEC